MKTQSLFLFSVLLFVLSNCETEDNFKSKSEISYPYYALDATGIGGIYGVDSEEKYKDYEENPFIDAADQPVSTFSIDADGGSYSNMRRFLNYGEIPPKASVRIEEYINYFTFDYIEPLAGENVSLESEVAECPWNNEHHLIRVGIKGKTVPLNEIPNSNYVFLIDVSGSMKSSDKIEILKTGFITLTANLRNNDKIAIVTYAGSAGVLLESTPGSEKAKIRAAIEQLTAGGSTAGAEGIKTAYSIARQNFIKDGNNRVILGTDGDFNVGISTTDELVDLIEEERESGIYLTVLGVGTGNLNDHMMEQIANKGNGNYEYIDNPQQIQKVFINEISKFYVVAKDSKIQLTFNKNIVKSYRLIGYENRSLDSADFDDDTKDAGEIGASQTITALYEVALTSEPMEGDYAKFDFRYKKPNEDQSRLLSHQIKMVPQSFNSSSENMRFAASVAGFGMLMKQSAYKGSLTKNMVVKMAEGAVTFDPFGYRKEFINLVKSIQ